MRKAKKLLTVILALILCLSLLGSLAGCNKKPAPNGGGDPTPAPTDNNGGNGGGSATPQPDTYVYSAKFIPITGRTNGFDLLACQDGRLLATCWEKVGENIPEGEVPE